MKSLYYALAILAMVIPAIFLTVAGVLMYRLGLPKAGDWLYIRLLYLKKKAEEYNKKIMLEHARVS